MALPPGFALTQTALRTYLVCPYRFRLRYLEQVPWVSLALEPESEEAMERGRRFHELARQHFLGLDVTGQAADAGGEVAAWWSTMQTAPPDLGAYPRRDPEAGLSIPFGDYRLAARYDLLAVGSEGALIVDWKTGQRLAARAALAGDIQTRVYLYVLAEGGAAYHGGDLAPESLGLLYWHPHGPQQVHLGYGAAQREADGAFLQSLVAEIAARRPEELPPTADESACGLCAYAPLCGRHRGLPDWEEEDWPAEEERAALAPD